MDENRKKLLSDFADLVHGFFVERNVGAFDQLKYLGGFYMTHAIEMTSSKEEFEKLVLKMFESIKDGYDTRPHYKNGGGC